MKILSLLEQKKIVHNNITEKSLYFDPIAKSLKLGNFENAEIVED